MVQQAIFDMVPLQNGEVPQALGKALAEQPIIIDKQKVAT
jgi:hypothetical protein